MDSTRHSTGIWTKVPLRSGLAMPAPQAAARDGVRAMGIEIWPARESIASPTCTAVKMPEGIDAGPVIAAARARYGVSFSASQGELLGKLIRIGHMGPTAQTMFAHVAVAALGGGLASQGVRVDIAAGLAAVQSRLDAES